MRKRPKIAITKPHGSDYLAYLCVAMAVRLAGGKSVPVTPRTFDPSASFDGIVVGGGQDVFPMLFDDTPKHGYTYDQPRDEMDMRLVAVADKKSVPVLGICRGAQLMNVARGGSLHLSVGDAYEEANYPSSFWAKIFFRKTIVTTPGSHVRLALGRRVVRVNSLHKQAAKRIGERLTVTAKEKNGVVQAIEDPDHPFFLGVQFHPEFLVHREHFRNLFRRFVQKAADRRPATARQSRSSSLEITT